MKKYLLTILCFTFFLFQKSSFCQFPIGENIKKSEKELKQFLKSKGFTFLKKGNSDKDLKILEYSDEFTIILGKNHYENVYYVNISTFRNKVMAKLKTAFSFSRWTYIGELPNAEGKNESFYYYKNYQIRMPHSNGLYQFIVKLKDDN